MALVPRQTGSSIKAFILAAAYEAGAEPRDMINGPGPCTVPDFVDGVEQTKTVKRSLVNSVRSMVRTHGCRATAASCASATRWVCTASPT